MTNGIDRVRSTPQLKGEQFQNSELLAVDLDLRLKGEVRFNPGDRALYSTDASNYRQLPIGVVIPKDVEDVIETVATCRRYGAPVLARGGGTSLAGQSCNTAVVIDMTKYLNNVLEIDPHKKLARVQPGTILDHLQNTVQRHRLMFGPDPATHTHCTLGGMIGNNSCGVHSMIAGRTVENVEELEILTYDGLRMRVGATSEAELERIIKRGGRKGEIYARLKALRDRYADQIRERFPDIPRLVSGYGLQWLLPENGFHVARALVGSEGTCVTILEATLRLIDKQPESVLLVLGYPDVYTAADHVPEIMEYGPTGLEGIDDRLIEYMRKSELHPTDIGLLPEGGGWLLVEFGGDDREAVRAYAKEVMERLKEKGNPPSMKLIDNILQEERIWEIRESGLGATANVPGMDDTWPGWEDAAVPPEKLGDYLRDFRQLLDDYGYEGSLYGHFGQGCVHVRIDFNLRTKTGIEKYRDFIENAAELVVNYGGSFSGEHGDGQARGALLPKMFGDELVQAFREFKSIWDPENKLNPGKVVNPYQPDENLRLGEGYSPWEPRTNFRFPNNHDKFSDAMLRCVGVGKCRRTEGGTMCPSYMVTLEEKHTTRGRARLLFEMLQGEVIGQDGWREEYVKEALDLCLACKGCKGDCPVDVDIATYKSEFLSHYYSGRLRPRSAYVFGLIYWWSRLAAITPEVANFFTQTPGLSRLAKAAAGIAKERTIPAFASQTFKSWYRQHNPVRRSSREDGKPEVILWPDTFNNHFHPETLKAGLEVLEDAGYRVIVPEKSLCCGRPLYESGILVQARRQLRQILNVLQPQIAAGIPVVALEPSCTSVFRDELINLFPNDEHARRLHEQTFTLGEFLDKQVKDYQPPKLNRQAVVHCHCHHKAIMRPYSEDAILESMELDYQVLDSGCCGMAGSFGFEEGEKYDVSIKAGERHLLPHVREAPKKALIIADGFSCREQITQTTDRYALHLAQVIQMALHNGPEGPEGDYPEQGYLTATKSDPLKAVLLGMGALAGGWLLWRLRRSEKKSD